MRTETELGPYAALVLEDVSELRRLERARRDMVANISHELRTPITSIRLLSDTLLRGALRDRERATGLLEKITSETDTLQQMAQELLDLSMIESGMTLVRLVPVELSELIAAAVDHLSEQAHRKGLSIEGQSPPHLQVLADPEQIGRVLTNLLHNAIKFTPEGGIVEISVELDQEWATVAVTDTGPGIPEHERERVFERFYRGDQARTGPGTGLGLAIAKHIVEAHGGRIWAEESPTPPGARLCFTLPTAER
jgi:two-component system phosphate regulon sensor histidine kinase PhoR